jgi:TolB-like protein/DNA-binding SARP family transcriptional activator/Tfp pilus assembly protein PilF
MLESRPLGRIRFQLLGPAALFASHSGSTVRVSSQKGLALLAYLAMNASRPISRAVLADLLWGDRVEAQARQSLRQAILTLRRDLGPASSSFLSIDDQSLSLAVEADDVDALQFAACAASPDPTRRQRCLDIPWAPFLDGFSIGIEPFDEWVVAERHRLEAIATRVFSDLARQFDAAGDGERAILALERLIAIDPTEEERHRRLLLLEARYRGADAALARGRELAAMLKREVDAELEPATTALLEDIRRQGKTAAHVGAQPARRVTDRPVADAAADRNVAFEKSGPERSPWLRRLPWGESRGLRGAALLASLVLISASAASLWFFYGKPAPDVGRDRPAIVASTPDAWQSPPLPSGRRIEATGPRRGIIPIIVLPFKTYEDAGSIGMIADMMTDDLTNALSRIGNFRVISRQTARGYHGRPIDVATVGEELGVRYALEGNIRMRGDKLRVAVELTDTGSRTVVWSASIEREQADRHVVQDEIVVRLVRELQVGSYPIESARLSNDADADALAYRGMAAFYAAVADIRLEAYEKAHVLFVEALQRDPQNVMARLGLGSYHVSIALQRLVPNPREHLSKAREIVTAVIRDKPTISGAHFLLGMILRHDGQLKEAIEAFERTIEINPSSAGAYAHIGFALQRMGRASEGIEHIRYAVRLSPKDPSLATWLEFAGAADLELDRYQEAIENFRRSSALTPAYPRPWAGLVAAHALAGDLDAARAAADRLRALAPNLTAQQLYQHFGRSNGQSPRLQQGLWRALTAASPPIERSWQSPSLPSKAASDPIARERGVVAIAVLPFRSHSENGDGTGLVAEMLTEDLTYLLSRIPVFRVISHQTAIGYRGQNIDSAAIGAELGVHYLVEGNISIRGNILRVNVALVDARNRLQIWSGRFERTGGDRHAVQAEIVNGLARELHVSVQTTESSRTSKDPDVHELIFKGFAAIQAARLNGVEALRPAETYFLQALERDPDAIRAQVGLGAYHAHMAVQLFAPDPAPHLAKAEAILQQVIGRHPNVSDAYPLMGLVHVARGHMDKALQSFERAVELNPSNAPSHAQIGRALVSLGQPQAGLQHVLYAMQLSPRDPILGYWLAFAGYALLELTRYDEAIDYLARAHATNPTQPRTALTYIAALAMAGRVSEAHLKLEELQKTHPHLSRERVRKMYSRDDGRIQTKEGIRRVLAAERADQSGAIK